MANLPNGDSGSRPSTGSERLDKALAAGRHEAALMRAVGKHKAAAELEAAADYWSN